MNIHKMSGNPRLHKTALQQCHQCSGETSLQNAMDLALKLLRYTTHMIIWQCDIYNIIIVWHI